jgi:hypothetical protein
MFNTALCYGDGTEWFLRAAECGVIIELLPEVLMYRRLHPHNITRLRAKDAREEYLKIFKFSLDRRRRNKTTV